MRKSSWFYWIAGVALTLMFGHALWRTLGSLGDGPAPADYPRMTFEERAAEYRALEAEVKSTGTVTPERYFQTLARMEKLDEALYRARQEERTLDPRIARSSIAETSRLRFLKDEWVNRRDGEWRKEWTLTDEQVSAARSAAGLDVIRRRPALPMDPFVPMAWFIVYMAGVVLTFGRFCIETEELGGSWLVALTDWRFPAWLMIWFVGIFKYPTEIHVVDQVKRAYARVHRFAAFALTSALSVAGGGCAAKRINTELETRPSNPATTWKVNVNTVTLPKYVGADGAVFHSEPVQQTSVTAAASNGAYVGLWHSAPLTPTDAAPNYAREVDGSVGWNGKAGKLDVGADLTWIGVTPLGKFRGDVVQLSGSVGKALPKGFGLSSAVQIVSPTRGVAPRRGVFFREGVNWAGALKRLSLSASGEVFHDSGAFGFDSGWLARGEISAAMAIGKHWNISVPIRWNAPLTAMTDGRRKELQGGLKVSWQP